MRKKKKDLSPERLEEIRTKDFFDMLLPGAVLFYADHYVLGDSYRCVWAIRDYPPSTEDQAILSQLGDRSGVTIRIYHRLVEPAEQRQILQLATRKNKLMTGGTDVNAAVEAEGNLHDMATLMVNLRNNKEPLLHVAVFLELKARSLEALKELQSDISMELTRSKITVDRLTLRQMEGFISVLPVLRPICFPSTSPARRTPGASTLAATNMGPMCWWTSTAGRKIRPIPMCSSWATPGRARVIS